MKSTGLLFRPQMILAIRDGRKDVTRRPVRGKALEAILAGATLDDVANPAAGLSPYGYAGDEVYTKETWAKVPRTAFHHDPTIPHRVSPDGESWAIYRADWERSPPGRWTPSLLQFRWAARFKMPLRSVTIEPVGEWRRISNAEGRREGFDNAAGFHDAWETMYAGRPQPYCWRLEFVSPTKSAESVA